MTVAPSLEETLQEFNKLSTDLQKVNFWLEAGKLGWIKKYEENEEDQNLGKGATFPDSDRTESLDIPALLRSQPTNVKAECQFHEELFKKLKFSYVELKAKEGFLKRALDIPPKFPTEKEIKEMEARAEDKKEKLKETKQVAKKMRDEVDGLIDTVYNGHAALMEQKKVGAEVLETCGELEKRLNELKSRKNPKTAQIREREAAVEEQARTIAELHEQVNHWKSNLQYRQSKTKVVEEEVAALEPKHVEAEAAAAEAIRISKSKDPQLEQLGIWYIEQIKFLKQLQKIREVRHISPSQVEISYDVDKESTFTLMLSFKRDAKTPSGWLLDAKFTDIPYPCSIDDLLATANSYFTTLDDMLSLFTREVPLRVRNVVRREKEIEELCEANDGISYDPESREVMVHVDATGRTFVVRLSEGYPWTGAEGIEVVGVEPKMTDVADEDEDEDELVTWKNKIQSNGIKTLTSLIQILQ